MMTVACRSIRSRWRHRPFLADTCESSTGAPTGSYAPLVNGWQVTNFPTTDGSFLPMTGVTEFTFAFSPDGSITGSTG